MTQLHFVKSHGYGGRVARRLIANTSIPWLDVQWQVKNNRTYTWTLESILANAINARRDPDNKEDWVIVSRREQDYQSTPVYGNLSYNALTRILDAAAAAGYIEQQLGYTTWSSAQSGRRTIYRGTEKLWNFLSAALPDWQTLPVTDARKGLSYIKDADTNRILAIDEQLSAKMQQINTAAAAAQYGGGLQTPTYHHVQISKNGVNMGGRIYTDAQNMERATRKNWTINGEACVEVDIVGSHINMLYSLVGAPVPADPYSYLPPTCREFAKYLLLVSINGDSRDAVLAAIGRELQDRRSPVRAAALDMPDRVEVCIRLANDELHVVDGLLACEPPAPSSCSPSESPDSLPPTPAAPRKRKKRVLSNIKDLQEGQLEFTKLWAEDCLAKMLAAHAPIAKYMYTGAGLRCMGLEGRIAIDLLLALAAEGIPAINIHDGYVVRKRDAARTQVLLRQVAAALGYNLPTKLKQFAPDPPPVTQGIAAPVLRTETSVAQSVAQPVARQALAKGTPGNWAVVQLDEVYDDVAVYALKPPAWTRWDVQSIAGRTYRVGWRSPQHWDVICLSGM